MSKNKYVKNIKGVDIDVYDVLQGFEVINPAVQHAIKKLLMAGARGYKDKVLDLKEAKQSIERAIELETKPKKKPNKTNIFIVLGFEDEEYRPYK